MSRQRDHIGQHDISRPMSLARFDSLYFPNFLELSSLGFGRMGVVEVYIDRTSGSRVAVKTIPPLSERPGGPHEREIYAKAWRTEVAAYCALQDVEKSKNYEGGHINVLRLLSWFADELDGSMKLVYPLHYANLERRFEYLDRTLSEAEARPIVYDILAGLAYIHGKNIAHRDLKLSNILCVSETDLTPIKICDFDGAKVGGDDQPSPMFTPTGSFWAVSPQVAQNFTKYGEEELYSSYTRETDLFSVGTILYTLLSRRDVLDWTRCEEHEGKDVHRNLYWKCGNCRCLNLKARAQGVKDLPLRPVYNTLSQAARDLLNTLLRLTSDESRNTTVSSTEGGNRVATEQDQETRNTANSLMHHPWFNKHGLQSVAEPEPLHVWYLRYERDESGPKQGLLGSGHFSKVYTYRERTSGEMAAAKIISFEELHNPLKEWKFMQRTMAEINIYAKIQHTSGDNYNGGHPNIVKLLAWYKGHGVPGRPRLPTVLMFEKLYDDLQHRFATICRSTRHMGLTEFDSRRVLLQITEAVRYLHERDICHRDIKPANILCADPQTLFPVKLMDFNLSKTRDEAPLTPMMSPVGSIMMYAAEQLKNADSSKPQRMGYSRMVDIYSLGGTLHFLLTGNFVFTDTAYCGRPTCETFRRKRTNFKCEECKTIFFRKRATQDFDVNDSKCKNSTPECKEAISRMLKIEPKKRSAASALLRLSWFAMSDTELARRERNHLLKRQLQSQSVDYDFFDLTDSYKLLPEFKWTDTERKDEDIIVKACAGL